ncbi:hypothetical protein FB451DRAFT_1439342 [Mycena latifolia]|nr:hypothetical protein FB451DRAFT_1439342 [Mycena latifolia]
MAAPNIIPRLPIEILEQILASAWHMPLSSTDRITLMRSSMLVNSTWADIFALISERDVYIPSSAFCDHFIQRLRAPAPNSPAASSSFLSRFFRGFQDRRKPQVRSANLACQSLRIEIVNVDVHPDKHNRTRLAALPLQITHLELRYTFSPGMPPWLVKSLQEKQERQRSIGLMLRSITNLTVIGAGANTISDMLRVSQCSDISVVNEFEYLVVYTAAPLMGLGMVKWEIMVFVASRRQRAKMHFNDFGSFRRPMKANPVKSAGRTDEEEL